MAQLPLSSATHKLLREHGLLPSRTRVAVYEWLISHHVHPDVDLIYSALRPKMPQLSRTTVYNVLHAFVNCGLASKVFTEDIELRYDGNPDPHGHFKCRRCGALTDLQSIPASVINAVGLPSGYKAEDLAVTLWGLCPKCAPSSAQ